MFYFALISYIDPYKDEDTENRRESLVFTTIAVKARDVDQALEKIANKIIKFHDEDERYYGVHEFFLDDLVEVAQISSEAQELSWVSLTQFGEAFGSIMFRPKENLSTRHYSLKPSLAQSKDQPSSSLLARPYFAVSDEETDEENKDGNDEECVPLVSIDRDRRMIKPLYKSLCKQQMRGILPPFKDISDGDLYELYVVEGCTTKDISELFGVKKNQVDYRRHKIGATFDESVLYSALQSLQVIDPVPYKKADEDL